MKNCNELARMDEIDILITRVSGDKNETVLLLALATIAVHKITHEIIQKYHFKKRTFNEIRFWLFNSMNSSSWDDETTAWNVILDSLGFEQAWDIIAIIERQTKRESYSLHDLLFI